MKRSFVLFLLISMAMASCGVRHSAKFSEMDSDIRNLEQQLTETNGCDDLQLLYFGILGLRTDLSTPEEEGGLSDAEFETISNKINDLEVMLNTKMQQLDCYKNDHSDDEIDTSEEECSGDYNVL